VSKPVGYTEVSAGRLKKICENCLQYKIEYIENEKQQYIKSMLLNHKPVWFFLKGERYTTEEAEKLWTKQPEGMFEMSPYQETLYSGVFWYSKVETLLSVAKNTGHKQQKILVDVKVYEFIMDRQKYEWRD